MQPNRSRYHEHLRSLWPWLPLWTVFALLAIFAHGPMPMYSTRTLAVAWEMWNGHHWIVPYFNGEPYSHKVPLLFWLIHAGWFVFGVSDIWPRVLEVGFGALQLVLAATLARRLFPDRPWVARATPWMLLALSYAFLFGLQIMYEVLLADCVLAALLTLTPTPHRARPRWLLFALCVGAGLLTKGPVMFLHVAFPWLLGPLWNEHARARRGRWYGFGALALLGGFALLAAWAWPAIQLGGQAYADELLFKQTGGRVVDSFAHARPLWWYLQWLPVLLFPFAAWPRAWVAVGCTLLQRPWERALKPMLWLLLVVALVLAGLSFAHMRVAWLERGLGVVALTAMTVVMLRRPFEPGLRFVLAWLLPVLAVFSLISGKQLYYPLPEFAGMTLLLATAISHLRESHPRLAASHALGGWPLALGAFAFGILLIALPALVGRPPLTSHWLVDLAVYSRFFGIVYLLLGALVLLRGRGELRRLAAAGLLGTFAANGLFTLALWHPYDLRPASALFARAAHEGHALATVGYAEGQFNFMARLTAPMQYVRSKAEILAFADRHPDGLVATYPQDRQLSSTDLRYALLVQPFRGDWLVVWKASTLAAIRRGQTPADPVVPTRLYPSPDYWRYRKLLGAPR